MRLDDLKFFNQSARSLAPLLLGKILCCEKDGQVLRSKITEVEAYCGEEDSACHSAHGKTERTKIMWCDGGTVYVYLCYGMHNMLNIVCAGQRPEAVLIRGVEGAKALDVSQNILESPKSKMEWTSKLPPRFGLKTHQTKPTITLDPELALTTPVSPTNPPLSAFGLTKHSSIKSVFIAYTFYVY